MFDIDLKPGITFEELNEIINADAQLSFAFANGIASIKRHDNNTIFIRVYDDGTTKY